MLNENSNIKQYHNEKIIISKNVFTIYVGLIASGYEYSMDSELAAKIKTVEWDNSATEYFRKARTAYCEVNPYWPRAAMAVTAGLRINASAASYGDEDFSAIKNEFDSYSSVDPGERAKAESWLLELLVQMGILRSNPAFADLWDAFVKSCEETVPVCMDIIREATNRIVSKFHVREEDLSRIGILLNPLQYPDSADFERMNGFVYTVCAKPNINCIIHEYLHNIFDKCIHDNKQLIYEYADLLNPVYERMFYFKYAWAMDPPSWSRVFEESLVRAATIWVNHAVETDKQRAADLAVQDGFLYAAGLVDVLDNKWRTIHESDTFIKSCLSMCEEIYNGRTY